MAHAPSVESVSRAASSLLTESGEGKVETSTLQLKVTELHKGWEDVLEKAAQLEAELAAALNASHDVMAQMKELRAWLSEAQEFIRSRRPVGGRPDSANSQLAKHKVSGL